ncbi:hypothetical protein IGI04_017000 [Brassica rapa subsp. trilocularis]|uniref:BHLH domain-containing protein n=1 Tax=Brassica rapa subsp. trilocularis TaxID=1813537 RepID=A0ABQ7MUK1_BRACM|nr:hypothetical protein IGI04_017000 [Brassica rapa subsp. trilocularis]
MMNTIGLDQFLNDHHTKPVESNLLRQSSSPAEMFTNPTAQNGYGSVRSLMNYEEDEQSPSSSSELRRHNSLSSRPPSSLGMLSQIPEIASEISFQYSHWNDPASFIDNLSSLKRETEDDGKLFQNGESGNRMQLLSHHLSLPNASSTASDMVTVDKYMQLQDSQTNTADMLDLAVDYIKDLQRQYKILNENRANCKCMNKEKNLI